MRRESQVLLALLALLALQNANGQQALSLGSGFPGDDSAGGAPPADAASPPPASTSPPASPSASPSPSPGAGTSPAAAPAPVPAPAPGPAASAPGPVPMMAPAPGPGGAAAGGAPAPGGAGIATGGGDMMAPAPGPAAAPQISIVYIQQAGNARMTPSPTDPTSGVLTMNNALDTTLYDQDVPIRKIGKTSSQNFLNTATSAAGAAPAGPPQWFAPAPTGILLGFNTSANVYILMSLSAPVYNYTTNTVNFNYLLKTPNATAATNATNGFLVNLFTTQPDSVSGAVPMTSIPKETILFTPSLLTTVPCSNLANVTAGSCTINNGPGSACQTALHGQWKNATFCA